MAQKKKIELTRLQGIIAVASFSSGVLIAAVCLFFIPPLGEIASSAVSIVSELLVLCGAILGVSCLSSAGPSWVSRQAMMSSSGSSRPNSTK